MLENEPQLILQNISENIRHKVALLESYGVSKMIQKEIMKKVPSFYTKTYNSFEEKVKTFKWLYGDRVLKDPSFPLVLIHNYKNVIKPRYEISDLYTIELRL